METMRVEWDDDKNATKLIKPGVDFSTAQWAFLEPKRIVALMLETVGQRTLLLLWKGSQRKYDA